MSSVMGCFIHKPKCQHYFSNQPVIYYCHVMKRLFLFYRSTAAHMSCPIWETIGRGFVQEYYNQFDNTNRMGLGNLYVSMFSDHSLMI